jgi:hypothetical protein
MKRKKKENTTPYHHNIKHQPKNSNNHNKIKTNQKPSPHTLGRRLKRDRRHYEKKQKNTTPNHQPSTKTSIDHQPPTLHTLQCLFICYLFLQRIK